MYVVTAPSSSGAQAQATVELVVHGDVPEEVRHGLPVVDPADGLGEDQADVHRLDLGALQFLHLVGDSVGHHHLAMASTGISMVTGVPSGCLETFIQHLVPPPKAHPTKP